jgi:soluble lytic murein transglycosylase
VADDAVYPCEVTQGIAVVRGLRVLVLAVFAMPLAGLCAVTEQDRQRYVQAERSLTQRDWDDYRRLRAHLEGYPLAIYLDYYALEARLRQLRPGEVQDFMAASVDTPLQLRLKDRYLRRAGRDRRWPDYLAISADPPNAVIQQCYYYRARLATGDAATAWAGAEALWVHGDSRPDECDPLFDAWMKAGGMTDAIAWQRMLKAFDNRRSNLMTYAARKGGEALQPWADRLRAVYRRPSVLDGGVALPATDGRSLDVLAHGLPRLARSDPQRALAVWQREQDRGGFDAEQRRRVNDAIAWQTLFRDARGNFSWLDDYLRDRGDDRLLETRLRTAIGDSDWRAVETFTALLSPGGQQATVWRFWQAWALQERGEQERAEALLAALAAERDYYGFLAAERLGRGYSLNHEPLYPVPLLDALGNLDGVQRAEELMYHDEPALAQSEWSYLVSRRPEQEREYLSFYAGQRGWHRLAIDAATRAQAWNRLELRFPLAYAETFERYGQLHRVPESELMSIARRESAFFPAARSSAGARGLMQLMPATAREVARGLGDAGLSRDLYDVENNVALGSAYYRQLLEQYQGNRVFTLAAYNAGPHRVKRWRGGKSAPLSVYQWVESIPFRETRNYVQGVLAYNVVYNGLRGRPVSLLSETERLAVY